MDREPPIIKRLFDVMRHGERLIIQFALSSVLIASVANILTHELSSWAEFGQRLLSPQVVKVLAVAVSVIAILISVFAFLLKSRSLQTSQLKTRLKQAFANALDSSSFNPHRLREATDERYPE